MGGTKAVGKIGRELRPTVVLRHRTEEDCMRKEESQGSLAPTPTLLPEQGPCRACRQ